tara:strand:- start:3807 stop:4985 length:1179 start_codon:yes stop_codon:yes gene_type:complete
MAKLFNRAKMTTSTTGTGTVTLGTASVGFQTFADAGVSNGDVVQYVIEEGSNFEIGTGTYTASGTTLSRSAVESSNSGSAINLTGAATVSITAIDDDYNRLEHLGSTKAVATATGVTVTGTLAATAVTGDGSALTGIVSIPSGLIAMWSGTNASIPSGWNLCDGNNSTPDLTDRFILGRPAATNTGASGGANTVTLAETNLPSHTHSISITTGGAGGHTPAGNLSNSGNHTHGDGNLATSNTGAHSHTLSGNTSNTGGHSHSGSTSNTGSHSHTVQTTRGQYSHQTYIQYSQQKSYWTTASTSNTGSHSHNISTNNTGNHSHNLSGNTSNTGNHSHNVNGNTGGAGDHTHTFTGTAVANHTHTVSGTTGGTGSGSAVTITPVYYTLAFIMKT